MNEIYLIVISISLVVSTILSYAGLLCIAKANANFERSHKLQLEAQITSQRHLAIAEEAHLMQKRFMERQIQVKEEELKLFTTIKSEKE